MTVTRHIGKLKALQVTREKRPGMYGDGGGLWLQVRGPASKSWLYRYGGREMGLGSAFVVSLEEARDLAHEARRLRREGIDPIEARKAKVAQAKLEVAKLVTFKQCADGYIEANRSSWTNPKHAGQWRSTLEQYCFPVIGDVPVGEIDTPLVLKVLEPIWDKIPQTAYRLRGRIECVLDSAKARGLRTGENAARWKNHLALILPKPKRGNHHAAMPYAEVPAFIAKLRVQEGMAARALEFAILVAGRTGEVVGARWDEIDLESATWTIPAERMKAGREHRVPLSPAAMTIISAIKPAGELVFPDLTEKTLYHLLRYHLKVDATAHGFRSSFSDWAHEQTSHSAHTIEISLAHSVGNQVEQAYRRGDLFQKRAELMAAWARFCCGESKVVPTRVATN